MPAVTVNGVSISYTDTGGAGLPVLLLHAFPLNSKMWEPQLESLADRFRFVVPDLKGFGDSDSPDDPGSYSMDAYADEVKGVLDELGIDRAVVVGLSMGGYVAFALQRRHGGAVAGLVLADTRAEADSPEARDRRTNQQREVSEHGVAALTDALIGALLADATRAKKPDVVSKVRSLMDNPASGYIGALEAMKNRPDSTADLTKLDVPTLVIVGENDALTPPEASRAMHEHIAGSRLVVVPDAGHLSNIEAPEAFNGAVAEFLAAV